MKRILHIIPYRHLFPPSNGGQLRCFHLMDQLALNCEVDVLIYQNSEQIRTNGYTNKNIRFINSHDYPLNEGVFRLLPSRLKTALRYRWLTNTFFETASLQVIEFAHVVKGLANQGNSYNAVILEHISSITLSPIFRKHFPDAQLILDAHNIDYKLICDSKLKTKIKKQESNLYKKVDTFWACSENDVKELERINKHLIKGSVVPNGVDTKSKPYIEQTDSGSYKKILFCGSLDYEPNREGLHWFYHNVWPLITNEIPDVILTIVGRGNKTPYKRMQNDPNIQLIGEVDDVVPYYQKAFIAIVPLLSGSGTRLKILEAMSLGNPVVTTSIGIEGIEVQKEIEAIIEDDVQRFAHSVIQVIKNPVIGHEIRLNAKKLIDNKYDWNVIGSNLLV